MRDGVECDGVWVLGRMGRMGRVVWGVDWVSANPLYIRTLYVDTLYILHTDSNKKRAGLSRRFQSLTGRAEEREERGEGRDVWIFSGWKKNRIKFEE